MAKQDYYLSETPARDLFKVTLAAGELLNDRFKIEQPLGEGRLSRVYLAYDNVRCEQVALKVVGVARRSAAEPVMEEVRQLSSIAHYRHVVHVYDLHLIPYGGASLACLSMEYANGGSLWEWLKQNKNNPNIRRSKGLEYFRQACAGVIEFHAAGIVHGDIKPENLLLADDVVKVADPGLSRVVLGDASEPEAEPRFHGGTPPYMSPEQIMTRRYQGVDNRADIFALGIMLFEILELHGQLPSRGLLQEIGRGHSNGSPPALDDIGPREARVIRRCLQKNPADRYENVGELLKDLENDPVVEVTVTPATIEQLTRQQHVDDLWPHAHQAFLRNDFNGAAGACHAILKANADHPEAKAMLEEIQRRYVKAQQAYELIERGLGYQSLDYLIAVLLEAIRTYSDHPLGRLVRVQLGTVVRQFLQMMEEADRAISRAQYESALGSLDRARQLAPGEPAVTRLMNLALEAKQEVEITRGKIDAALEQGDRHKALALARALDRYTERIRQLMAESRPQRRRYGTAEDFTRV
jgi:tetratricopeptide (TPR) repeat protein